MTISCPLVFHFRAFSMAANAHYAHFWIVKHFDRRLLKQGFLTELLDHVSKKQISRISHCCLKRTFSGTWMEDISGTRIGGPRNGTGPKLAMQGILAHWMSIVFLEISTRSIQSPVIWIKTKTALYVSLRKQNVKKKVLLNEHE